MKTETFSTPGPVRLELRVPSGDVDLETVEGSETRVEVEALGRNAEEEDARIELRERGGSHEVVVDVEGRRRGFALFRGSEWRIFVQAPHGLSVKGGVSSADVEGRGHFGTVELHTASGDVSFEELDRAELKSASGDVELGRVEQDISVHSASGDVAIGRVGGRTTVRSASGDVTIREAGSATSVHTASGDQAVEAVAEGDVRLVSASGDVEVGIRRGSRLWVDAKSMSGATSSELEIGDAPPAGDGPMVELRATTMSGDIQIRRA